MNEGAVDRLQALGMSLYEARLTIALLRHGPQNGNELSRSAGVPSSKVYSTLERLATKGFVHIVKTATTTEYLCVSPKELTHRLRSGYEEPLEFLERALPEMALFQPAIEVLSVTGLDAIREGAGYIVQHARSELHLSIWEDDVDVLLEPLRGAVKRGVSVFGMLYGEVVPAGLGSWLVHSYQQIVADRIGGRMLTLVADGEEALVAHIPRAGTASGVRTRNPVIALIVTEYLHHDLVLQRAQLQIGFDEWDEWWQADPDLRTTILGRSLETGETEGRPQKEKRR